MKSTYGSVLAEVGADLVVADLGGQSADKDLALARLGLLGVDLLVVDDVVAGRGHLLDGLRRTEHDERKATRAASLWVCLNVNTLNVSVLAEVFAQLLWRKEKIKEEFRLVKDYKNIHKIIHFMGFNLLSEVSQLSPPTNSFLKHEREMELVQINQL